MKKGYLTESVNVPRWLWLVAFVLAMTFGTLQFVNERRWQSRVAQYQANRNDIIINAQRVARIEDILIQRGELDVDAVVADRAKFYTETQK